MPDANRVGGRSAVVLSAPGPFSPCREPRGALGAEDIRKLRKSFMFAPGQASAVGAPIARRSQAGVTALRAAVGPTVPSCRENRRVDLARIAWFVTVLVCLVTVVILLLQGYYGYAGVTFAVALSAAINLL